MYMHLPPIPTGQQLFDELISKLAPELTSDNIESFLSSFQGKSMDSLRLESRELQIVFRIFDQLLERRVRKIRKEIEATNLAAERKRLDCLESCFQVNE